MKRKYRNTSRVSGAFALLALCITPIFSGAQILNLDNQYYEASTLSGTTVTITGQSELHLTGAANPIPGTTIDLLSEDSWVFFHDITVPPSYTASTLLSQITVNGSPAVLDSNVRVVQYGEGAVVIPYPAGFQPMQVFDGENFAGTSSSLSPNTSYGAVLSGKVSSFKLKRGYTATICNDVNGNGYSVNYVAADGDLAIGALPAELNNQVNFIRIFPWRWTSKKGIAGNIGSQMNIKWWYDWNLDQVSTLDKEYVPIRQQRWWPDLNQDWAWRGASQLLGYNEPSHVDQANMTVGDAIYSWPDLLWTGLRVGSPASADDGRPWLYDFMSQVATNYLRVDFVACHYYWGYWNQDDPQGAANQMYGFLKDIYDNTGHRPIWITEWNNGANWTGYDPTPAQEAACIAAMSQMLDNTPWVERYAPYNWVNVVDERRLEWDDTSLTQAGVWYRDNPSLIGYQQLISGDGMDPSATYSFENGLSDDSGSGNNAVSKNYPDLVAGHNGGTALQFDGVDDHVILPDNLSDGTDFTFAAWVNWTGSGSSWQRIFDFGIMDSSSYMFLTPNASGAGLRFAINVNGTGEQQLNTGALSPNTWVHVAVTLSGNTGRLYVNGSQAAINNSLTYNPVDLGAIQHWLGRSMFAADPYFSGKLDDVIIRNVALSGTQIAALAANNQAPQVVTNTVDGGSATPGVAYAGSVAGAVTDPESGVITWSKLYGPAWLNVAADGTLSGTPGIADGGPQYFTIRATDDAGQMASIEYHVDLPSLPTIYIQSTTNPVPDADDIYQFTAASTDTYNVAAGDDNATYIANDRGAQGQFFTTGSAAGGYDLSSIWLQHVPYGPTYSELSAGDTFTVRITDPTQINTAGFVVYSVDLTVDNDSLIASGGSGSGRWVQFDLGSSLQLQPNTTYGFDVFSGTEGNEYWEISGVSNDVYGGGSAYTSGANGVGDNTATTQTGDRTFLLALAASGSGSDTTPPAAPTGLGATPGDGSVSLDWADNTEPDLASYTVYRSTTSGGGYSAIASGLATSAYTDNTPANGTTYYYVVTATDTSTNESANSTEVPATPLQNPPSTPTALGASVVSDTQIDISWGSSTGADSYNVKRAGTSGGPYTTIATGVATTSYSDTGLTASTTYYYVVSAVNAGGESADSVEVSATTQAPPDTTPPANPTGLGATAGDTSVSLDWADNAEPDLASYTVYRSTTSGSGYAAIASDLAVSAYADNTVVNGTTYYYVVTATDTSSNESGSSLEVAATPQVSAPAAPTGLGATAVSDTQISLSWTASSGAASYNVKRAGTSGGPYTTIAAGVAMTSYGDSGLTASTAYYYVVSAVNAGGESADSTQASATTLAGPGSFTLSYASTAPTVGTEDVANLSESADDTNNVGAGDDAATYFAYDRSNIGQSFTTGNNPAGYTLTGVWIKQAAYGVTWWNVNTPGAPLQLRIIQPSGSTLNVLYTADYTTTGSETDVGLLGSGNGTGPGVWLHFALDTPLALNPNTQYAFDLATMDTSNVYFFETAGTSTDSYAGGGAYVTATKGDAVMGTSYAGDHVFVADMQDTTPPAAPTGLGVTAGDSSVSLDWADNSEPDMASYTVYRSTTSGSGYVSIASGLAVSAYTDNSAVNGTTYYYVVTATDTASNESPNSTEVSATPQASTGGLVFSDSFESGLWTNDSQNDWYTSTRRATDGSTSAEVNGLASDSAITSVLIDLGGVSNATITFDWYIESSLDSGEYVACDVSTDGGANWSQVAILQGNVDTENVWHNESIDVTGVGSGSVLIRYRGTMNRSNERADVDNVVVTSW